MISYAFWYFTDDKTNLAVCKDQDLRVQGGKNRWEGRLEVCYNQAWGTLCNNVYGEHAANIFCVRLNFDGEYIFPETLGCMHRVVLKFSHYGISLT